MNPHSWNKNLPRETESPAPREQGILQRRKNFPSPILTPSTTHLRKGTSGSNVSPEMEDRIPISHHWGQIMGSQFSLPAGLASPVVPSCRSGSGRRDAPARGAEGGEPPARRPGPRPRSAGRRRGPPPAAYRHWRPAKPPAPPQRGQYGTNHGCWPEQPSGGAPGLSQGTGPACQSEAPVRPLPSRRAPPLCQPVGREGLGAGPNPPPPAVPNPAPAPWGLGLPPTHPPSSSTGGVSSEPVRPMRPPSRLPGGGASALEAPPPNATDLFSYELAT